MIDLSADLGEGSPREDEIWPLVTSANVACGGHTGDRISMVHASYMAKRHGVRVGAHPSYPDRENFGRITMRMDALALRREIESQINALRDITPVLFVKPHGALYNDAHADCVLADIVVEAMLAVDPSMALCCSDRSQMAVTARARGVPVIREAFADRRYEADGSLMSRKLEGSLLSVHEATEQARLLVRAGIVVARDGSRLPLPFDTLCVHADMEHSVERLTAIRSALGM